MSTFDVLRRGAMGSSRARCPVAPLDEGTLADLDDLLRRLGLTSTGPT